jgi:signal transduction histidine kinase
MRDGVLVGRHGSEWNTWTPAPAVVAGGRAVAALLCVASLLLEESRTALHPTLLAGPALCVLWGATAFGWARLRSAVWATGTAQFAELVLMALMIHASVPFDARVLLLAQFVVFVAFQEGGARRALMTCAVIAAMLLDRIAAEGIGDLLGTLFIAVAGGQVIRSEQTRRREAELAAAVGRFLASLGPDSTAQDAFAAAIRELSRVTGARRLLAALDDRGTGRLLLISSAIDADRHVAVRVRRLARAERDTYFPRGVVTSPTFRAAHPCRDVTMFEFGFRDHWTGRLFLLDPTPDGGGAGSLRGFEPLLQQCVAVLSATRDLPRIRRRAGARERARLGRELHDGVVQELAGLDVELEILRRRAATEPDAALALLQGRLRAQVRELRQLQQRARSYDVDAARLPTVLADLVDRFGRDTGIVSVFAPHAGDVELPPRVCGEIVRIVQEALVNVRRHSGARQVVVRFACEDAAWKLWIEDDGRGLARWGTPSPGDDRQALRAPAVIQERVKSIGGTLRLPRSGAGGGACLEIALARGGPWVPSRFESC